MPLSTKIVAIISAICFLILGGFIVYKEHESAAQLKAMTEQMTSQKQLADNITRSMANFVTKDNMDSFAKDNGVKLDTIRKDLATLGSSLTAMNKVAIDSSGEKATNLPSTSTTPNTTATTTPPTVTCDGKQVPCPNTDPYGYSKNIQNLHLDEEFANNDNVPIGDVSFDASNAKPWSVNILPREYSSITTLGVDEDQKYTAYNNFSINVGGKKYPINVTNAQLLQQYPSSHFTFWPRLFLGLDGGVTVVPLQPEMTPNLSLGVIGYGKYRTQPDLSILQVGVGYGVVSKNFQFTLMPISYNLGKNIPLMSNFYVGPSVSMDIQGHFTAGIGLRVGL